MLFKRLENLEHAPNTFAHEIHKDPDGFMWFLTQKDVLRFDGYELIPISQLYNLSANFDQSNTFTAMLHDQGQNIWIGTKNQGLHVISGNTHQHIELPTPIHQLHQDDHKNVWAATDSGLLQFTDGVTRKFKTFEYPNNETLHIKSIIAESKNSLLIAAKTALFRFNLSDHQYQHINFSDDPSFIWDVHKDNSGRVWLSTDNRLYIKHPSSDQWRAFTDNGNHSFVKSITSNENHIWFGTAINGVIEMSMDLGSNQHHINHAQDNRSLTNNDISTLFYDPIGVLWVAFFDGSLAYSVINTRSLGLNKASQTKQNCMTSNSVYHFTQDQQENVWITTQNEVIKINAHDGRCRSIDFRQSGVYPLSTALDATGQIWVGSSDGLYRFHEFSEISQADHFAMTNGLVLFISLLENGVLAGTTEGLFFFDEVTEEFTQIQSNEPALTKARYVDQQPLANGLILLATNQGLAQFDGQYVSRPTDFSVDFPTSELTTITLDVAGQIWIGTAKNGLYHFKTNTRQPPLKHVAVPSQIHAVLIDAKYAAWIATDHGLIKYDLNLKETQSFTESDGLQTGAFNPNAAFQANDGRLFFGGRNGFNSFYPSEIGYGFQPPQVAITELKRFNQLIIPGVMYDDFKIQQTINKLPKLSLTHRDYVVNFKLSAMDYTDPEQTTYSYKLDGFDPGWSQVNAANRSVTYTNLPTGKYNFLAKATNKFGVSGEQLKSLAIEVKPAPWLTWYALTAYLILTATLIYYWINRKLQANQRLANMLRKEVAEKTKELNIQKQNVESLLLKKNQLFSHVTHEFRTPLTLILGPIKKLIQQAQHNDDIQTMGMIKRNANRLLSLVEQLLQLAKISDFEEIKTTPQNTKNQIQAIFDSFTYVAKNKNIDYNLANNDEASIDVTDQFIDVVLGNLISNALKYTPTNGQVTVAARNRSDQWVLTVKDTGCGLNEAQQNSIFERFNRLDNHQGIEGIGIGLSIVKDVVNINGGHILVDSEPEKGSEFSVSLPITQTEVEQNIESNHSLVAQLAQPVEELPVNTAVTSTTVLNQHRNTMLIIEDNDDMRDLIHQTLEPHYNVLQAVHGQHGVALAIEHVPDLIVCDVMMPVMDGYKVSRIIRADERTSHIPLILLTALNDKASRIKGWRENVDAYMTKPFDQDELLVQLDNMLTIRDILSNTAATAIQNHSEQTGLTKVDQAFVDKLHQIIEQHFTDPLLNRSKLAGMMAVSDRQLQRKLKALINQNPMDLLREYRLKQAAEQLKDGHQVSQIADNCGFNSLSYFSQCFKAQYGLSPKQYQTKNQA